MLLILAMMMILAAGQAYANPACAVCTVAVGASLELARSLGVDDSVVGVWAGALLALLGYWLILWFDKKNWHFYGRDFLLMVISVGSIGFMYMGEIEYRPQIIAYVFNLDALLFSTILGAVVFIYSSKFYQWMKAKNGGHAHFPFEKVVVPVVALALVSTWFYYNPLCTPTPAANAEDLLSFME